MFLLSFLLNVPLLQLGVLGDAFGKLFGFFKDIFSNFFGFLGNLFSTLFSYLGKIFGKLFDFLGGLFKKLFEFLGNFFSKLFGLIWDAIKWIGNLLKDLFQGLVDLLVLFFEAIFGLIAGLLYLLYMIGVLAVKLFIVIFETAKLLWALAVGFTRSLASLSYVQRGSSGNGYSEMIGKVLKIAEPLQINSVAYILLFLLWFITAIAAIKLISSIRVGGG